MTGRANIAFASTTAGAFVLFGTPHPPTPRRLKLSITTKPRRRTTTPKLLPPVHPGEILREDFMKPLGISVNALARELHVPVSRISKIVNEERDITPDTALRAARYFGTSAEFWLNLQSRHDLLLARTKDAIIRREVRPREAGPAIRA
ncbi:MAG TPA: HigA family addiction module antitoxin [Bryobacteraceae bacterium]|nr:HigA family addiction module antitoxin [Bryobacteraceae bacterium]